MYNITSVKRQKGTGGNSTVESYTYDGYGKLTGATILGNTYSYTYDQLGNITGANKTVGGINTFVTLGYDTTSSWRDRLVSVNGSYVVVEKIQHELLESPITVYNFEVEDYHTYYVGETGVLVHNTCGEFANVYELVPTHSTTKSKREMRRFVSEVATNGITDPIKYVQFRGSKYIVDGHHRVIAAKMLKIYQVPAMRVDLPYAGYKTKDDLFW